MYNNQFELKSETIYEYLIYTVHEHNTRAQERK